MLPIDMDKSFNPSPQLKSYMERAMRKEKEILEKRRISKYLKNAESQCHK